MKPAISEVLFTKYVSVIKRFSTIFRNFFNSPAFFKYLNFLMTPF